MKKPILFILILFLFVSLMGVVSASQDSAMNNMTLTHTSDEMSGLLSSESAMDNLQISKDNEILATDHDLSGSTLAEIQTYLNSGSVVEGDTVYLGTGTWGSGTWTPWDASNVVNVNIANIIISGGTSSNPTGLATISAGSKIFSLNAAGITLKNIQFTNTAQGPCCAVNIESSDSTISNCVFDHCNNQYGGAIHSSTSSSNTKIENCNFTNNEAIWGGYGGAMYLEGSDTEITGCNFDANTAQNYGAIYSTGTTEIRNSDFTNNKGSNANGGAVYISGENSVIDNCNFIDNVADANHLFGGAIAIAGTGSSISNSNFERNKAGHGGAVYIESSGINVENCNFTENEASTGGAINIYHDDATITNCDFTSNTATESGGAIYIADDCHNADMSYCNFTDNNAASGKAIYADGSGDGKVSNCELGGVSDLSVVAGYPKLTFTLATDYSNIVVGNIEGASGGEGSKVPLANEDITLEIRDSHGGLVTTVTDVTDSNGQITYDYSALPKDTYTYTATYLDGKTKVGTFGIVNVEGDAFSDIQRAIDNADAGSILMLKDITYLNDLSDEMVINKPISIIGIDGTVLNAEGKSGIFRITNVDGVTLQGITFINGNNTDYGGAIDINGGTNGAINNCTFINNTANIGGGAVRVDNTAAGWNFYNSTFINNTALSTFDEGDGIGRSVPNGGGAIWSCVREVTVDNCSFRENKGSYGGALRGAFNTVDSEFIDNIAFNGNGGAIDVTINRNLVAVDPTLRYINSTFINNSALGDPADERSQGGALHMYHIHHVDIVDSEFYNNTADRGGAVDLYIIATVSVENSSVENNTAFSDGGGFFINATSSPTEFRNSDISNNKAGADGGAIYLITNGAFFDNITSNNNSAARGGSSFIRGNNAVIQNSTFNNNSAIYNGNEESGIGGGLDVLGHNCKFTNVTANNNNASLGGAAFIRGDNAIVDNSTFDNNTATLRGGGLNVAGDNCKVNDVDVSNNRAGTDGGAVYVVGNDASFTDVYSFNNTANRGGSTFVEGDNADVHNCTLIGNNAFNSSSTGLSGRGGGLDLAGENCKVYDLEVSNNHADGEGGAVYIKSSDLDLYDIHSVNNTANLGGSTFIEGNNIVVHNCTLDGNNATLRGGALNILGNNCTVYDVDVSDNNAGTDGGAVYVKGNDATFYDVTSFNNTASRGGSTFIEGNNAEVHNCTLDGNKAISNGTNGSGRGGGLDIAGENCKVYDLDVSDNHADGEGGAIYIKSDNLNIHEIHSVNNTANLGGSTFIKGDNIVVHNCTLDGNNATLRGGALNILGNNCTVYDVDVSDNNAGTDGGAVFVKGNDATFYNVTSFNNTASRGGSTFIEGNNAEVHNCTLDGNKAISNGTNGSGRGGGIDIAGENCKVYDLDVSNNHADNEGGAIYIKSSDLNIYDIQSVNNTASRGGSAFIEGNNITVSNSTFSNNKAIFNESEPETSGIGGAIDVLGNDCKFINVTSVNNTAYRGGSTFVRGNNTVIKDCVLDNNTATLRGGGLNVAGDNCTIENVDVSNNKAGLMGGAIYVNSNGTTLTNVTADNNTAERGGAAFINGTNIIVRGGELNNNKAVFNESNPDASGLGGGFDIVGDNILVDNVHSNNNTAYRGGSSFIRGNNVTVSNCNLDNNSATLRGGGINIAGDGCNIENVSVSNNKAGLMGGAIYVNSNGTTLTNVTADNNTAERGGGAFINGTGVRVLDSEFNNNKALFNESNPEASGLGGGMDIVGNDCYINNTHSNNNTAYRGGSTFIRGDNTVVENCNLDNNSATLRGGGLNIAGDNCTVNNISVSNNKAGTMGGGLYILSNGTTINGITADNNTAERGGSAFINGTNVKVLNGELNNNRAIFNETRNETSGLGGGFDIVGDNILVDNVHSNNNSAYRGGSTFIRGNNVTVSNCNLDNNTADLRGGGLNVGGDNCTFENLTISNCNATEQGGAVYVIGNNNVFDNVTSVNNTARFGGSSCIEGDDNTVRNCVMDNNTAEVNGGGLAVYGNNCDFINVSLSNNQAKSEGGAVYVLGNSTFFDNITSKNNTAKDFGGSTQVHGNNVTVKNSIFTDNNVTAGAGGAISVDGDECSFINNTISSNEASGFGGGIYAAGNNCTFSDNNISDNTANFGGGIGVFGENSNFTNNNITFNEAHTTGGAAYVEGWGEEITYFTNNNISSNHAELSGGGIGGLDVTLKLDQIYGYNNTALKGGFAEVRNGYEVTVENSTFISNHALGDIADSNGIGGGFLITGSNNVDVQADFYNNTATNGSAIYVGDTVGLSIHDSKLYDNQAHSYYLLAAPENGTVYQVGDEKIVKFSHIGGDNIANAIHNLNAESAITIRNITFPFYHNGVVEDRRTPNEDLTPVLGYSNFNGTNIYIDDLEDNQVIYYEIYNNETGELIRNGSAITDIDGSISIDLSDLGVGVYLIKAWYNETTYYTEISNETIIVVVDSYDPNMTVDKDSLNGTAILYIDDIVAFNITVINTGNRVLGNVTVNEIYNSSELEYIDHTDNALWIKSDDVFTYQNVLGIGENATFTIWFRTLTNGTLINNVTAKSNITNETNSSANVTVYNKITINVTKVWNDSDDHDGFRPQNVTFVLYADGNEYARIYLNGTGNVWTGNFTDLPTMYSNGTAIVYTVDELPVANYTSSVTNSSLANYTITNTRVVNFTSVNVTKVWNDSDNHDGFRPVNVTFVLYADGVYYANVTLSGSGNVWNASFTDLPVYANGKVIVYTIGEVSVANYTSSVTNSSFANYTITNTRVVNFTSVNVTKVWNDSDNHDGFRPVNVTFVLYADGVYYANVTLSGSGNVWNASFTDLPVYANGKAVVYTIGEVSVANYTSSVTNSSFANYTITNTRVVNFTSINVTKVWNDSDNHDGFRPVNVTFVLYADGVYYANVTLSGTGNVWNASFTDLPVYANGKEIVYSIQELTVPYYVSAVTNSSFANYTITNTRVVNFTSVNVTKVWNDSDNHDGFRPVNVTFVLYADGVYYANVTLSGSGNVWNASFTDLPVYANGKAVVYTIGEVSVANYTSSVTNSSFANYTITNTRVVNFTSINVTKVWNDSDNHDGFRPVNVTFVLYADGVYYANVTLSGTGNVWNASFTDLPVYANGKEIVYSIQELTVPYYVSAVTNSSFANYTITNTRVVNFTSINVTKVWNDSDNHDGFRPVNVTFVLYADGVYYANVTLSGTGNVWNASFTDLPVYANGKEIVYSIQELTVPYYVSAVTNSSFANYTITNTRVVNFTSINVTKVWNDSDNHDGFRPVNVTFVLYADGVYYANVTLSGTGNVWNASFTDLPVYANGKEIVYSIQELTVPYYVSAVTNSSFANYTITNTRVVNFTSINVTKVWNDSDNHDGFRPVNVTFVLYADGVYYANVTLSGTGNVWNASFTDLPVYANGKAVVYTIGEVSVANYTSSVTNSSFANYTITNTRVVNFTSINVTKVWNDSDNHDGFRPVNVTFVLYADGVYYANVTLSGTGNVWNASFTDLPVYANGKEIVYSIQELTVPYYVSAVTNSSFANYTITNTRVVNFTSINVTKVWNDSDNHDGFRPVNVTFVLYADGVYYANVTLSGTGNVWNASFTDLPVYANGKEIVYSIQELTVPYYVSAVTNSSFANYTITNTRVVNFTSVNVTKVWNDSDNHDGFRPVNVTFVLYADGVYYANVTLSGSGNVWNASFTDLPVYLNGKAVVYTIGEVSVANYTSSVTNSSFANYTITNTRVVNFTSINVTKVWNDSDNHDGFRPVNVTFVLYADGVYYANVTLSGSGNVWNASFTDLPVYLNGKAVVYTIGEVSVANYTSSVTNSSFANYTITNTRVVNFTSINVTKVWNDSDNHDGFRPVNVTFVLYADGVYYANVTLSGTGNVWNASFTDLPVYANGKEIVYSIQELTVPYYVSAVTNSSFANYTITNTRVVNFTSVNVTKVWNDSDNHDGFRPVNVTFVLYADGVYYANVTLSGSGNVWNASFTDLPVYANGKAVVYTIGEVSVANYTSSVTNSSFANYTITNTRVVNFTSINVTKVWNDSDNHDGFRPVNVTFVLYADGVYYANVTLSGSGNVWNASFTDLPVYLNGKAVVYTIGEVSVANYTSSVTNSSFANYTITNTRVVNFTSINVTKVWNDSDNHDGFRPVNVTFVLYADGVYYANVTLSGTGNVWNASFTDLPVYANGKEIVYSIQELTVPYYVSAVTNSSFANYTITNTRVVNFTSINVTKVWNDSDNHDGFRPVNVTFVLYADGVYYANVTLNGTGNVWNASFTDLPVYLNGKAVVYTIGEVSVANYTSSVTNSSFANYTITNTRVVNFTSINVTKVWNDSDNHDGFRPVNVTFVLYADGVYYANVTLSGTGNVWNASFTDLPVYANGKEIVYSIQELTVPYYVSAVTNSSFANYTITNTRVVNFTSINVTKVWNDSDNHDGFRPVNVTFVLYADGVYYANVTLSGTGNVWNASFTDLPVYLNGKAVVYTIGEVSVANYTSSVTNSSFANYTITNTRVVNFTSVNVTKVWNDYNNYYGNRPQNVTFVLYADGVYYANVTLSGTGNVWNASFTDLPVYADGKEIVYSIQELTVDNYTSTVTNSSLSNYTITNNYIPQNPNMTVEKITLDNGVFVNNTVRFVIVVTNTGKCNLTDVKVTEDFDAAELRYESIVDSTGRWSKSGDFVFDYDGNLTVGESANFTIVFTALVNGTLLNQVNASSNQTDNKTGNNTTTVYKPNMSVVKVTLDNGVFVNNTVRFVIVVTNTGDCNLTDVKVTEIFNQDELKYESIVDSTGRWSKSGDYVFVYDGNLTVGESANFTIVFTALVNGTLLNQVNASSNQTDNKTGNNTTTVYKPNMSVVKVTLDNGVFVNNTVRFLIVVTNTGDCNLTDVKVTEIFNTKELRYESIVDSTGRWSKSGDFVFDYDGNLTVGESANFTVVFTALVNGTLLNQVNASSNQTDNKTGNNTTTVYKPNLDVVKVTLDNGVFVNNTVRFVIVVTNTGDCNLTDVKVTEIFNTKELKYVSIVDSTGRWSKSGDYVFVYDGNLTVGESANFTVVFTALVNGTLLNQVNASSNQTDNKTGNNTTTVYKPNLDVVKVTLDNGVFVNNTVRFMIVVTNTGDCNLTDVKVTEIFNTKELRYESIVDSTGRWSKSGDYVFDYDGNLTVGESANFTVVFTALVNGTLVNQVNVSSNGTNKTGNNTTTVYKPDMDVVKVTLDDGVFVNNTVRFAIVVTNTGDCNLTDVKVTEIFNSEELKYEGIVDSTGKWSKSGDYVFDYDGNLTVGESANFTVVFTALVNGTLLNQVNVSSNGTNKTGNNTTTVYKPDMDVVKVTLDDGVFVNNTVRFMIVVTNTGDCNLTDVKVTEIFNSKELKYEGIVDSTGKWSKSGDFVFDYDGNLTVGESANFTIVFTALVNGTLVNQVNVSSNGTNKTGNNTTTVYKPNMTVEKISLNKTVLRGDNTEFIIVVTNTGDCNLTTVKVTEIYNDDELRYIKHTNEEFWTKSGNVFDYNGVLAPNESVNFTITFKTLVNGTLINKVNASSNETENKTGNNTTDVKPVCDLEISKLVNTSEVFVNDMVEWSIIVKNNGPNTAENVIVTDYLPNNIEYTIPANCTVDGNKLIWNIGDLGPNKSVSLILVTKLLAEGQFDNFVSVNTPTNESDYTNNNASNSSVADPICDLIINKTVNASSIDVGDSVEWTISIINVGPSTARDVKVIDTLPEGALILSANPSAGTFDKDTRVWEIGSLAANNPVSLILVTKIVTEGNITNVVVANTSTYEPNKTNNEANNTTVANPGCDLEITKLVNASEVYEGDLVEWTIVVINKGPSVAYDVIVNDTLPSGLNLISSTPSTGTYSNGIWNIGTMDKDATASLVLITQAKELGHITNIASVNSTTPDNDTSNNIANNTTDVVSVCDLEITKLVNASSVNITDFVEWTVRVVNKGPNTAKDVKVTEKLPNGLKVIKVTPSVGSYANNIWTIGDLEKDASVSLVLITQVVKEGNLTNVVIVNSTTPDRNETNNKANNTTEVNPVCDLEIIKLVSAKKAYVGEVLTWTIKVTNNGPSAASDVKVLEDIPNSLKFIKAIASKGTYDAKSQVWTIGKLASGSSVTLEIVTKVLSVGNITNPVEVTTKTPENNRTNNKANNTTNGIAIVDLAVIKNADKEVYHIGDKIQWIITVVNYGPCDAHDVVAYDILPDSIKFTGYEASKGSYDASTGRWEIGNLTKGEVATLYIECVALIEGKITNEVNVTCNETDSNLSNNYDNCTVEVIKNETVPPEIPEKPTEKPPVMYETGNPLAYLVIAFIIIFGSFWTGNKKK